MSEQKTEETIEVVDHPEAERYEVRVDGALAGRAEYVRGPGQISFTHTEVDPAFGGRGLAGRLARKALDDAQASGLEVLPFCPFFRDWIGKHPDYAGLVPANRRAEFGL
jgi:uncharacterized protein